MEDRNDTGDESDDDFGYVRGTAREISNEQGGASENCGVSQGHQFHGGRKTMREKTRRITQKKQKKSTLR